VAILGDESENLCALVGGGDRARSTIEIKRERELLIRDKKDQGIIRNRKNKKYVPTGSTIKVGRETIRISISLGDFRADSLWDSWGKKTHGKPDYS